jgi:hypothetical protein
MSIARIILVASVVAAGFTLGGCESIENLTNMLDTKKKLPGDRKPVFPEGVPGVQMGVPPEMMKGYNEQQEKQAQQPPAADQKPADKAEAAAEKPPEKPKPRVVTRPKPKPENAPAQAAAPQGQSTQQTAAWPAQQQQPAQPQQAAPAWPGQSQQPQQQQQAPAWPSR